MSKRISIIGAGTAGLACAIFLARQGHHITVYETVSALMPVGAGILLQPTGQQVLQRLELLEQLWPQGAEIDALRGYNRAGWTVMDLRYRDIGAPIRGLGMHRANLAEALRGAACAAGVTLRYSAPVQQLTQTGQDARLHLSSGEIIACDAVIIASGTRSALRDALPVKKSVTAYPWGALWAIGELNNWQAARVLEQVYDGPRKLMGILPTGQHPVSGKSCYSLFWSLRKRDYPNWQTGDFAQWLTSLREHWPEAEPLLQGITPEHVAWAEYSDVVMERWHHGRIVCIGDCAHAMSPQLGQGANLALVDADILSNCINVHSDLREAFSAYSVQRRAHLRYYQRASRWLTPLYQSDLPLGLLRDAGTWLGRRVPFIYQQTLATLAGHKTGLFSALDSHKHFTKIDDYTA